MEKVTNVAVLIDAENVASHSAKQIFDEASNYGNIMVKRIFADWSKTSVRGSSLKCRRAKTPPTSPSSSRRF